MFELGKEGLLVGDFGLSEGNLCAALVDLLDENVLVWERREMNLIVQKEIFIHALPVGVATAGLDAGFQKNWRLEEDIEELALDLVLVDVEGEKVVGHNRPFEFLRDDAECAVTRIDSAENELACGYSELVLGENSRAILRTTQNDSFVVGSNGDLLVAGVVFDRYLGFVAGEDVADTLHFGSYSFSTAASAFPTRSNDFRNSSRQSGTLSSRSSTVELGFFTSRSKPRLRSPTFTRHATSFSSRFSHQAMSGANSSNWIALVLE